MRLNVRKKAINIIKDLIVLKFFVFEIEMNIVNSKSQAAPKPCQVPCYKNISTIIFCIFPKYFFYL